MREHNRRQKLESFGTEFTRQIVMVCREMGWELDYVLGLGIGQFNEVCDALVWLAEKEKNEWNRYSLRSKTFR